MCTDETRLYAKGLVEEIEWDMAAGDNFVTNPHFNESSIKMKGVDENAGEGSVSGLES